MAMLIEIHRWQVAQLIEADPARPERELHELIILKANDRRLDGNSGDREVYVGMQRIELGEFIKIVREEIKLGTAHLR